MYIGQYHLILIINQTKLICLATRNFPVVVPSYSLNHNESIFEG